MILSDREIQAAIRDGIILIDPVPDEALYTSTALDLTLDGVVLRWNDPGNHPSGQPIKLYPFRAGFNIRTMQADSNYSARVAIDPKEGFDLEPRKFILGYTQQKIYLPNRSRIAARVEGKSSLARMGVGVHVTAPTIHAGFGYNLDDKDHPGLQTNLRSSTSAIRQLCWISQCRSANSYWKKSAKSPPGATGVASVPRRISPSANLYRVPLESRSSRRDTHLLG